MSNPFDDQDAQFLVLRNDEGQHSLWPQHIAVPAGWSVVLEASQRAACAAYIESHWQDMRPLSLLS
ncbi:MbtH family protein [Janthinobacterium agaricidamnosum]|uniref:Protein mbtH n=1 Tax=Janthinobacterium agaricidamnosum NBRC 102515 = DSM 9628 TaxID=1349767 RepID=W0V4C5_9BURK|nr:MbtH family protein [Janthinobacterium agaricidamnosum]CDG83684.1 protein mbtH [Janthinobacterium agaricidamnosum NBRC 102515 = DSM 9628]